MKVFVDLGAYNGDTVEKAISVFPDCDFYYAFEPFPQNFKLLEENFSKNEKIRLFNKAAGVEDGSFDFYPHEDLGKKEGADEGGGLDSSKINIDQSKAIKVGVIDFSKFLKDSFDQSDEIILKIDIEGTEYDLLEDLIETEAIKLVDKIYCEWHKGKINVSEERHSNLIHKLRDFGFDLTGKNKDDEFSKVKSFKLLSIVIATYNRKDVLKELLDSLKEQTDKYFEVVVAVDGSRDGTIEMLEEYKKNSSFELRFIDTGLVNEYGLAVARNLGIKESRGEIVVIIDDDSFPTKDFVKEHKEATEKNTLTGGGRLSTDPNDKALKEKMKVYLETFGDSVSQKFKPVPKYKWIVENNTSMSKDDWLRSGLFDESIREYGRIGQKFNRSLIRKGFKYQFVPAASIVHHVEYKQNDTYKKKSDDTAFVSQRTFIKEKIPWLYKILKKIRVWIEYR